VEAVAVLVVGVLALRVVDRLVFVAPAGQLAVNGILVGAHRRLRRDGLQGQGLDRFLLDVVQQPDDRLARALDHAEHGRLLRRLGAASPGALQPPPKRRTSGFADLCRLSLVPGLVVCFVALDKPRQRHGLFFLARP